MKKYSLSNIHPILQALLGALAAILCFLAVSFIFALISSFTENPTSLTGIFSLLSLLTSGAIFGLTASRIIGNGAQRLISISLGISVAVMLLVGVILKGGAIAPSALLNYLAYLGVGVIFAFLGKRRNKKKK